ncbi:MAG: phytanoyl-CoA dioxygenase family protein [Acidobacteriota bacterium]
MELSSYPKLIRRKIAYAGRHFTPTWRYGFNLKSTLAYRFDQQVVNGEAERVLDELNRNGVAITSVEKLFSDTSCFDELCREVDELESDWAGQIAAERANANRYDTSQKTFLFELLGKRPHLDPDSVYARFALQQPILQTSNAYFGMYTQLRYYNVWHTLTTNTEARESQLWHRDREDHSILKLFVYFMDIDEGAGPFTYAPGTHHKGASRSTPEFFVENGVRRTTDEQMAAVVPQEKWIKGIGKKGTILFADTAGYHKGGLARTHDRLMYTCMFTSPTSQAPELFNRPSSIVLPVDKAQSLALAVRHS